MASNTFLFLVGLRPETPSDASLLLPERGIAVVPDVPSIYPGVVSPLLGL